MKTLRKHTQNLIIDSLSLVCMIILTVTGFILQYKISHGSRGATILGLSRHEWGDLHFWVALVLVVTVIIHLVLHMPWIKGVIYPKNDANRKVKLWLYSLTLFVIIAIGIAILASPVLA